MSAAGRVVGFAGLGLFAALSWAGMAADPPLLRTALSCLPVIACVAVIAGLGSRGLPRLPRWAANLLAAAALLAATTLGAVIVGLPARLLVPGGWSDLGAGLDVGFAAIGGGLSYPYDGPNEWSRLLILLGAPLLVGLAALLGFLPLRRRPGAPRLAGLAVLLAGYGTAATIYGSDLAILRGTVLLVAVVAWLWLPRIGRRQLWAGVALVALGLAVAIPVTLRYRDSDPLVDYESWTWAAGPGSSFDWDHHYGPIDWDRSGDTVMLVRSEQPNYWKLSVLDRFDGRGWVRSGLVQPSLELPASGGTGAEPDRRWRTRVEVTIGDLRSKLVAGPGTARQVLDGIVAEPSADHATLLAQDELSAGDAYELQGYAPDPDAERMRAAGWRVPPRLAGMTAILVPARAGGPVSAVVTRGIGDGGAERARRLLAASPYGRMARLAERLTADAPTAYDAVKAVEGYLLDNYEYSESPPQRKLPLEAFLFEDRIGYCQQFSGAMALMLRMRGIPARVVGGFSPGAPAGGGTYRVRDLDAHSWVEVYFPGIGWVPFDPTPAAAPAELRTGGPLSASSAASSLDRLLHGATPFARPADAGKSTADAADAAGDRGARSSGKGDEAPGRTPALPLLLAALLAGAALAPGLLRRARQRRLDPQAAAAIRVAELDRALRRLGFATAPDLTLAELERTVGGSREPLVRSYLGKLRALRYEPRPARAVIPSGRERRALRRRLHAGRGLLARIAAYRTIPPLSPRR